MSAQTWSQPESLLHELFGPDFVLPEQFYGSHDDATRLSGERALMWAVFADGIESYRRTARRANRREQIEFNEAERWIMASERDWVFSFVNLCETFGFEPMAVRASLRAWKRNLGTVAFRRQRYRPITLHAAA